MTLKEFCIKLGAPLMIRVNYASSERGFPPAMGTHMCYLDPGRCDMLIDGKVAEGMPHGIGFGEADAMIDLVRVLRLCRQRHERAPIYNVVIRCRSVYDNIVSVLPIPTDLTL